jgi:uncharacterized membrane protein YqjE
MEQEPQSIPHLRPGLIGGLAAMVKNLLGLLLCRLELAALELAEARNALLKLVVLIVLGAVTALFALACWTGLVIVLAWDSLGWKILAIVAGFFTLATVAVVCYAKAMIAQGKLSLPATMAELRNDRDALL